MTSSLSDSGQLAKHFIGLADHVNAGDLFPLVKAFATAVLSHLDMPTIRAEARDCEGRVLLCHDGLTDTGPFDRTSLARRMLETIRRDDRLLTVHSYHFVRDDGVDLGSWSLDREHMVK